jgi:predicted amidohydrolase
MVSIVLLHLAPVAGDVAHNQSLLEAGLSLASGLGAEWVITPELAITGYEFASRLGTDWIGSQKDLWTTSFLWRLCSRLRVTLFLGHAERDAESNKLYNTVFVIGPDGRILGKHRKHTVVPGIEGWACRNEDVRVISIPCPPVKVGVLICADAYTTDVARHLKEQGAQLLVSCAAWGPFPHGPETSWEDRSRETGLPLFVCNRTGVDASLDFSAAESVIAWNGSRVLSHVSPTSTLLFLEWDLEKRTLGHYEIHRLMPNVFPASPEKLVKTQ